MHFFSGLHALGRLLAVGSEWAGYATLVPTGEARKAARAAADEASEQLGRQGARQASCPYPKSLVCYSPSSSQIASIFAFTSGDMRITSGHSRVKPSSFHLVVASKPILLP